MPLPIYLAQEWCGLVCETRAEVLGIKEGISSALGTVGSAPMAPLSPVFSIRESEGERECERRERPAIVQLVRVF
jgi:hypothetical protein